MDNLLKIGKTASSNIREQQDPNESFPWWLRLFAKIFAIGGGFIALFFAIIGFVTLSPRCLVASILQGVAGFAAVALEAPFCCAFVDFIEKIAAFSESRQYWHKAVLFMGMGITPILICPGINTIIGSGIIFCAGLSYGLMALGKKADRNTMMNCEAAWNPNPTANTFNQP